MKTKTITLKTYQLKDDLTYVKHHKSENLSYDLRDKPENFDPEKELDIFRNRAIREAIGEDSTIISTSSKRICSPVSFEPLEEITINYEQQT
jgi:hypothetical protein